MGDSNELSLAFFDEGGDVVKTKLDVDWLGATLLLIFLSLSSLLKSVFFLLSGFWLVL